MRHRFRGRPRLAAAAVLSLAGGLLAAAVPPAQADCIEAYVFITRQNDEPYYLVNNDCVKPTDWERAQNPNRTQTVEDPNIPDGAPTGVGFSIWTTSPI